jgi:hypothetical protein
MKLGSRCGQAVDAGEQIGLQLDRQPIDSFCLSLDDERDTEKARDDQEHRAKGQNGTNPIDRSLIPHR